MHDPNRTPGRLRTDLVALYCFAVFIYLLIERRWPLAAALALVGAVISLLSPLVTGPLLPARWRRERRG